jgi:hypothetical protein
MMCRPTGKQLFLMNKAGSDLDNEVEAMISAGELEVPFSLYVSMYVCMYVCNFFVRAVK